jgi:hypothetical protein
MAHRDGLVTVTRKHVVIDAGIVTNILVSICNTFFTRVANISGFISFHAFGRKRNPFNIVCELDGTINVSHVTAADEHIVIVVVVATVIADIVHKERCCTAVITTVIEVVVAECWCDR